jgi:hypothetical protein
MKIKSNYVAQQVQPLGVAGGGECADHQFHRNTAKVSNWVLAQG